MFDYILNIGKNSYPINWATLISTTVDTLAANLILLKMKIWSNLIAFSDGCCFDSMIEDSGVSSVNEAFGVDGNPFGVGQADGVDVLCQTGLRL